MVKQLESTPLIKRLGAKTLDPLYPNTIVLSMGIVQQRVMMPCPLCGLQGRIERITDAQVGIDLATLTLTVDCIYTAKGRKGLWHESHSVRMGRESRAGVYHALAAKVLPLVLYLRATVPEFRQAITEVVEITVHRVVPVEVERPVYLERPIRVEKEVPRWINVSPTPTVKSITRETGITREMEVKIERVDST